MGAREGTTCAAACFPRWSAASSSVRIARPSPCGTCTRPPADQEPLARNSDPLRGVMDSGAVTVTPREARRQHGTAQGD